MEKKVSDSDCYWFLFWVVSIVIVGIGIGCMISFGTFSLIITIFLSLWTSLIVYKLVSLLNPFVKVNF